MDNIKTTTLKTKTSTSSAIFNLVPSVLVPDCWPRVTRTLGTGLPPSWYTEMYLRVSFCLRLRSTCERRLRLRLRLRLRRTCEPAFIPLFVVCEKKISEFDYRLDHSRMASLDNVTV